MSDKRRLIALILCGAFGFLGVHRFYVGKIGTGILWLLTGGLFGIGALVDYITILFGTFKDNEGMVLEAWFIAKDSNDDIIHYLT